MSRSVDSDYGGTWNKNPNNIANPEYADTALSCVKISHEFLVAYDEDITITRTYM